MDEWIGPLAEGRRVLTLSVIIGVSIAIGVWTLGNIIGLNLSPALEPYFTVGGFVIGIILVYILYGSARVP